jgi:molybdopterin synthase catalytic subunit
MIHCEVSEYPLSIAAATAFVDAPENGAMDLFVGRVRNHNLGQAVQGVSYDAFVPLAEETFRDICREARQRYGEDIRCYISHFRGRLDIGGLSVIIAAGSPHRAEAFQACRFMIERLKHRAPIWKQEHYVNGDSAWVKGHALCCHADVDPDEAVRQQEQDAHAH